MMIRLLLVLVLMLGADLVQAQGRSAALQARLEPGSTVLINGSSTINSFTCRAAQVEGWATLQREGATEHDPEVTLVIPVRSFDCGQQRMNSDFYAALQAAQHPAIRFELERAMILDEASEEGLHTLRVEGRIFIAGAERRISIDVEGHELEDGKLHVVGETPLLMSDFGIDPPSALLGLIQARDRIVVRFDLMARVINSLAENI